MSTLLKVFSLGFVCSLYSLPSQAYCEPPSFPCHCYTVAGDLICPDCCKPSLMKRPDGKQKN